MRYSSKQLKYVLIIINQQSVQYVKVSQQFNRGGHSRVKKKAYCVSDGKGCIGAVVIAVTRVKKF